MGDTFINKLVKRKESLLERKASIMEELKTIEESLADTETAVRVYNEIGDDGDEPELARKPQEHHTENNKKNGAVVAFHTVKPKIIEWDMKKPRGIRAYELMVNLNTFVSIGQITELAHPFESKMSKKDLKEKISDAMIHLKKTNPELGIISVRTGLPNNSYVWGIDKWIDESGKIKKENMYKEKEL